MDVPKMLTRWRRYRRHLVALARSYEEIGDSDAEMFRKIVAELDVQIAHVEAKKPPPVPESPTMKFFLQTEEFHEDLKIADWNARQMQWVRGTVTEIVDAAQARKEQA
jgi:hypothetical protein